MQDALGNQWDLLSLALKNHYGENENGENHATGLLSIDYPWFMQWPLSVFRLMGALVNKRGKDLKTSVSKINKGSQQFWHREIVYPNGKTIIFDSVFVSASVGHKENGNEDFIEYISSFLGLRMAVFVENHQLHYESKGYILKLGTLKIPIPEWLALGHVSILEWQTEDSDEQTFNMDCRIKHPLFGELFCYKGRFTTEKSV